MKRKIVKKIVSLGVMLGIIVTAGYGAEDVLAETNGNQAPVISGTSYVQVLKGDVFKEKDILNRVFAMDYEDGDLNGAIHVVSNNVKTDQIGTYFVEYEVADKEGAKDTFTTTVEVVDAYNEFGKFVRKTMYTKEDAKHLLDVELYRGYYHDRQNLGIYLNAGTTLYVRLANWEEVNAGLGKAADLRMDIFGDDSDIEKEYIIPADGNWLGIPGTDVTEDMVPFVRTLNSKVEPIIEYYYTEGAMEELTYYGQGDDETAFFETWNGNDHQYAVFEGERVTMLIPRRDKDSILNNTTTREEYRFKTLDQMLDYYKALQDQYDTFAGLVWDADAGTDKNIRARYFAKADATGVGAAYYSAGMYTAENAESMNGYLKRDWMTMHEIAHGYDSSLAYGNLPLVECINNMFGYFYEKNTLAEGDTGWSSMQQFELVEQRYLSQIKEGKTFTNMDFDARLYGMLNALTAGDPEEMMSDLYSKWREIKGKAGCADFIVEQFSETTGYNLVPYFEEYGFPISEQAKSSIYEKNYPIANRFAYHFADMTSANTVKTQIGDAVNGLYGLVVPEEMVVSKRTANLKIAIEIDDFDQVKGREIRILDGTKVIASANIEEKEFLFEELPIGTYRMELPAAKGLGYYADYTYVTVKDGKEETVTALYVHNTNNAMKDDAAIVLQGLSDNVFATVSTDIAHEKVSVTTEKIQPHYYFDAQDGPYGSITVTSPTGEMLYTRSYIGNQNYEYEVETFDAPIGSKVKVTHLEIGGAERRVKVKSNALAAICAAYMSDYNTNDYSVEFVITEQGLKRSDWNDNTFSCVRGSVVEDMLAFMNGFESIQENRNTYQKVKAMAVGMIESFDEETQEEYKGKYPYLFKADTTVEPMPEPPVEKNPFTDVKEGDYFYEPVLWALKEKVTSGYSATIFAPHMTCTRAEVVTFLWRANGCPEPKKQENPFVDVSSETYYYKAVLWAVENGITAGYTPECFAPNDTVTRAQVACFLWRAAGEPSYTTTNPFVDVKAGAYYADAVLWAYENKITAGYHADQFAPDMGCTRCQVVSFLYRAK